MSSRPARPRQSRLHGLPLGARLLSILGIILLPLLLAAGCLWVTSGSQGRLTQAEAAIVNLDQGAVVDGKPVRLGQDYALELKNQQGPNFTWRYGISATEARDGLASGRYAAAVVIPDGFSRVLTGTSKGRSAERATLVVERSPVSGVSDQVVFQHLSNAASGAISSSVTRTYLDQIMVTTTSVGEKLGQTATVAQEARAAADALSGRADEVSDDSAQLTGRAEQAGKEASTTAESAQQAAQSARELGQQGQAARVGGQSAEAAQDEQSKALEDASGTAREVVASVDAAHEDSDKVAKDATTARERGARTAEQADEVAKAAKANRDAARQYTGAVGEAVEEQAKLQEQLGTIQKSLETYVDNVQTVTKAVQQVRTTTVEGQSAADVHTQAAHAVAELPGDLPLPAVLAPEGAERIREEQATARQHAVSSVASGTDPYAVRPSSAAPSTTAPAPAESSQEAAPAPAQSGQVAPAPVEPAQATPAQAQSSQVQQPVPSAISSRMAAASRGGARSIAAAPQQVMPAADPTTSAERDRIAAELRTAASSLQVQQQTLASLQDQATSTSQAAAQVQSSFATLVSALPTSTINLNNGVGKAPAACNQRTPAEIRACKQGYEAGYNAAVGEVNAALDAQKVSGQVDALVADANRTQASAAALQQTNSQTVATLQALADRVAALQTDAQPQPQPTATVTETVPGPTVTVTADPTAQPTATVTVPGPTVTVTATPSSEPTAQPTPEPSSEPTPQPTVTVTAEPTPSVPATLQQESVTQAVDALEEQSSTVQAQVGQLDERLQSSRENLRSLAAGSDAATTLTTGAEQMSSVADGQAEVVAALQESLGSLNEGMTALGERMGGLDTQATALDEQTTAVSDNASRLAEQTAQLNTTLETLVDSATSTATTVEQTVTRTEALQQQISGLQQSSGVVDTGTAQVAQGAQAQLERSTTVAQRVTEAQDKVPTYDQAERQKLSEVVSQPIDTTQTNEFRNVGWVSMLLLLSLWAGAMGLHSTFTPVSRRAVRSTDSWWRTLLDEMAPGAGLAALQGLAMGAVAAVTLDLSAGRNLAVTGALVLSALTFAAVNHSLVAFLRGFGRLVAAALALVAGASLLTSGYPDGLAILRQVSPVTPAVDWVRSLMTGADVPGPSLMLLLAWLLGGVLFSVLAILRARQPEVVRVPTVHDQDPAHPAG